MLEHGRQPRALQRRPPLRGRRRPLPGDRQARRSSTSPSRTPTCSARTFGPGKQLASRPATRRSRSAWSSSTASPATQRYLDLAKFFLDVRGPGGHATRAAAYNQRPQAGRRAGPRPSATPCAPPTCTPAWPTSPRSPATRGYVARHRPHLGERRRPEALPHRRHRRDRRAARRSATDYELPNMTAYNETCAAIGNAFWNHRLFLLHGDAKYLDVLERTLYNGFLSGVSLDGTRSSTRTRSSRRGQHQRSPWFGCACCPGNVMRFLAVDPRLRLRAARRHALREPLRRRRPPTVDARRRPHASSSRRRRATRGTARVRDHASRRTRPAAFALARAHPRLGAQRAGARATSTASPTTLARAGHAAVNGDAVPLELEKGYARIARDLEARATSSS